MGMSTRVLYPRPTATLLRSMALYGEEDAAPTFLVYGSSDLHHPEVSGKSGMMTQLQAYTHLEDVDDVYSPRPNLWGRMGHDFNSPSITVGDLPSPTRRPWLEL